MDRANKRILLPSSVALVILLTAILFVSTKPVDGSVSWKSAAEGFLAVASPCCSEASLWDNLELLRADQQRARPATAAEAVDWLNELPYREPDESDTPDAEQLELAARNSEVRCVGKASGPEIPPDGDDEYTLNGVHFRRECTYAKWKVWAEETAQKCPNERHRVWVDDDGFFHGRVDYWK